MFTEEHLYSIALRRCKLIGDVNFQKLVNATGSAKEVWQLPKKELKEIFRIGNRVSSDIGNEEHLKFAEQELKFCEDHEIKIRLRHQLELPFLLNECVDAPAILFQKGEFNEKLKPISIVGTRKITHYGKRFITDFFQQNAKSKIISISGLALGVDSEVHTQSLANNIPTIAVLAHGFQTLYPSKNRKLAEQILAENGALFTEFNSDQKPDREHFLQRNRIVAGLSSSTIVVETAFGGGSLSTATYANGYNRDVFALPGKITDEYSQGCNLLIEQNKASTISTISKLIDNLGLTKPKEETASLFPSSEIVKTLGREQREIFEIILNHPKINLDEIATKTKQNTAKTSSILLELELLGLVRTLSGKQYLCI